MAERLFDYYTFPRWGILFRKLRSAQLLHDDRKKFGAGGQVKENITSGRLLLFDLVQSFF